uniref:4Fe-4S dicluster domain-containing protein n=1 Tax=candidate division WOR-3 bacterium TaxID=2052148 RepID=A0A7V0Z6V4_UNCW3
MDIKISEERRRKRPYVVIECPEKIPCNPCVDACPQGAITIKGSIIELPEVDYEKCTGCLLCIPKCPGLAIFVIDEGPEQYSILYIPYELLPIPEKGAKAIGLDREGKEKCEVEIVKVLQSPKFNHCAVVGISVPKGLEDEIRFFKLKRE